MKWNEIPSLSSLRAFEATARHQNYSKAAQELNVTHAAIAQHVKSLEAFFSEKLVFRAGRGMNVTEKGAILADKLNTGFTTIADGVDEIKQFNEQRPLSITLTPSFASNWLIPRIGSFWAKYPDIAVNLNPSQKLVDLSQDAYDMAIRFGNGDWGQSANINVEPLLIDSFVVVAQADLVKGRNVNCLSEISDLSWNLQEFTDEQRMMLVKDEGVDIETSDINWFQTNELVLSAVRSGMGLSLQHASLVEREIASGVLTNLCRLNSDGMGYFMLTRDNMQSKNLITFQKWLRAEALKH